MLVRYGISCIACFISGLTLSREISTSQTGRRHIGEILCLSYPSMFQTEMWDPDGVFYTKSTPGSEKWSETDGRLCRVSS